MPVNHRMQLLRLPIIHAQFSSNRLVMWRLLLLSLLFSQFSLAEETALAQGRSRTERWADRCTNFTTTTWAFKAPDNFLKWLDVFSDPAIWLEFTRRGMDPEYALRSAETLLDAETAHNFLEWADPGIPERWAVSLVRPDFYVAVSSVLFDSRRMMRWAMLPLDPKVLRLAGTAINPIIWAKWLAFPADSRVSAYVAKAMDPLTVEEWRRELADSRNYPLLNLAPNQVAALQDLERIGK